MLTNAFRGSHSLYRRYQALLESTATAAGFALLVVLSLRSVAIYPENWVVVIGIAIGILGVRWPLIAYLLAVGVMAYPIYTVNLYLAVIFIAIAALGHRLFAHFLGATTLVLATPWLAQYHLHWLVPVLGGLWWGGLTGMWVGGLAAVWAKLAGGMAGLDVDAVLVAGQTPGIQLIAERFGTANSLDTLLLLVEPFATNSSMMLYNLLQIVGWAAAGVFVGTFSTQRWVKYHVPWSIMVITAGGGLILLATHLWLPYWLQETSPSMLAFDPMAPLFALVTVIIVGTFVYSIRESLDLPVAPKRRWWSRGPGSQRIPSFKFFGRRAQAMAHSSARADLSEADIDHTRRPVPVPSQSELPEWEPPQSESGLIMLEID
jgi:hypothetical protein